MTAKRVSGFATPRAKMHKEIMLLILSEKNRNLASRAHNVSEVADER